MQLSEPHRAGEATPSCARLDHGSCQRVTFILLGAASLFQPPDPQQDMVSLNRGVNRALVQLVWPCRGQMSGLAPPGALMAAGAAQRSSACPQPGFQHLAGAEHLFLLGCSVCLSVHGSPGDGSRVGKRLNLIQSLSLVSNTCPRMCGCAASHCIRAHHSTSIIWALENLGTFLP